MEGCRASINDSHTAACNMASAELISWKVLSFFLSSSLLLVDSPRASSSLLLTPPGSSSLLLLAPSAPFLPPPHSCSSLLLLSLFLLFPLHSPLPLFFVLSSFPCVFYYLDFLLLYLPSSSAYSSSVFNLVLIDQPPTQITLEAYCINVFQFARNLHNKGHLCPVCTLV